MSFQAQLVMLAWIPFVLYFSRFFAPGKVVIAIFIISWLFLPQRVEFSLPGLPDYTRTSAACYSALLYVLIFDTASLRKLRLSWFDVPMLVCCFCPLASSLSNGLGMYDGLSAVFARTVEYGIPYFCGRLYLGSLNGLRALAVGIFIGGLVYAPLCLYEARFYAQLHALVYGYPGHPEFFQALRQGGYRPTVFMRHGLSVGMWMMASTFIGFWLWQSGMLKKLWGIPVNALILGMLFTFMYIRSTGAYLYFVLGILVLFISKWFRNSLPLMTLVIALVLYIFWVASGNFSEEHAGKFVAWADTFAGSERAQSLNFRFENERILVEKALERPIFGWGGWGRNRIIDEWTGEDKTTTDSLLIIMYGINGWVGLISLFGATLIPSFSFPSLGYPANYWFNPKVAPVAALVVVVVLYILDNCLNDQYNPVFTLASGGIAGLLSENRQFYLRSKEYLGCYR